MSVIYPALESGQVRNNSGYPVYKIDPVESLRRFLILGTEKNKYNSGRDLKKSPMTQADCPALFTLLDGDYQAALKEIREVSLAGRAAKQDMTLFALAAAARHSKVEVRKGALALLGEVCRTPTHLFQFLEFYRAQGTTSGWGRLMREAVSMWYNSKKLDNLIYQVTKYGQREGWSHKDVLRLSHPKPPDSDRSEFYKWVVSDREHKVDLDKVTDTEAFNKLAAFEAARLAPDAASLIPLIREHNLVHEHVPNNLQNSPEVWEAMLENMPLGALVRNLGRMTSYGVFANPQNVALAVKKLKDVKAIERARIHPFNVLVAYTTYVSGGTTGKGSLRWSPVAYITRAINELFYLSFGYVEPTGKRFCIANDVSGSMHGATVMGTPGLTAAKAAGAMAMTFLRTEPNVSNVAFSNKLVRFPITKTDTLEQVVEKSAKIPFGSTDCSLPITEAQRLGEKFDVFVVLTDNEVNASRIAPAKALQEYRKATGIDAKLIVIAFSVSDFTIADPNDPGSLDIVGFDSAAPAIISEFVR